MNFNWLDLLEKTDIQELIASSLGVREYLAVQSTANALSQEHELGKAKILVLGSEATSELSAPKELNGDHYTKLLATYS